MAAPSCRSSLRPIVTGRASHVVSVNSTTVRTSARAMQPPRVICIALVYLLGGAVLHANGTPESKWPEKKKKNKTRRTAERNPARARRLRDGSQSRAQFAAMYADIRGYYAQSRSWPRLSPRRGCKRKDEKGREGIVFHGDEGRRPGEENTFVTS